MLFCRGLRHRMRPAAATLAAPARPHPSAVARLHRAARGLAQGPGSAAMEPAGGGAAAQEGGSWEEAEEILFQMITQNVRDRMKPEVMDDMTYYLRVLGLEPDSLSVIHVAGTKGKGSTCAMVESILRHGAAQPDSAVPRALKTGLFTSPHLIDVRERIRIDGAPISREVYLRSFWTVYGQLRAAGEAGGIEGYAPVRAIPGFFRFLFLLATHVFISEGKQAFPPPSPALTAPASLGADQHTLL